MERVRPTVAQHAAAISGALAPHTAELSGDIYQLILREIPQLRADSRVLALLEASVAEPSSVRPALGTAEQLATVGVAALEHGRRQAYEAGFPGVIGRGYFLVRLETRSSSSTIRRQRLDAPGTPGRA